MLQERWAKERDLTLARSLARAIAASSSFSCAATLHNSNRGEEGRRWKWRVQDKLTKADR